MHGVYRTIGGLKYTLRVFVLLIFPSFAIHAFEMPDSASAGGVAHYGLRASASVTLKSGEKTIYARLGFDRARDGAPIWVLHDGVTTLPAIGPEALKASILANLSRNEKIMAEIDNTADMMGNVEAAIWAYVAGRTVVEIGSKIEGSIAAWLAFGGGQQAVVNAAKKGGDVAVKKAVESQVQKAFKKALLGKLKQLTGVTAKNPVKLAGILKAAAMRSALGMISVSADELSSVHAYMSRPQPWDSLEASLMYDRYRNALVTGLTALQLWNDLADPAGFLATAKVISTNFLEGAGMPVSLLFDSQASVDLLLGKGPFAEAFENLAVNEEKFDAPFAYYETIAAYDGAKPDTVKDGTADTSGGKIPSHGILFLADRDGDKAYEVYARPFTDERPVKIIDPKELGFGVSQVQYHPGTNRVAFVRLDGANQRDLGYIDLDGGMSYKRLYGNSGFNVSGLTWSSDGSRIFFGTRNKGADNGTGEIFSIDVESGQLTNLTHDKRTDYQPHYSNGLITFVHWESVNWSYSREIYMMAEDGTGKRNMIGESASGERTSDDRPILDFAGKNIAFVTYRYGKYPLEDISLISLSGSRAIKRITATSADRTLVGWSPGNDFLVINYLESGGKWKLRSLGLDGMEKEMAVEGFDDVRGLQTF